MNNLGQVLRLLLRLGAMLEIQLLEGPCAGVKLWMAIWRSQPGMQ